MPNAARPLFPVLSFLPLSLLITRGLEAFHLLILVHTEQKGAALVFLWALGTQLTMPEHSVKTVTEGSFISEDPDEYD